MKSPIKPFKAASAKAPWLSVNVLEKVKAASKKPAASGKVK